MDIAIVSRVLWSLAVVGVIFGARKSMDTRGDLRSYLMFGGRSRWSGKSSVTSYVMLFVLVLFS